MKELTEWTNDCEVRDLAEGQKWLDFCIKKLLDDRKHKLTDEVVHGLTFEELLGGLAAGKTAIDMQKRAEEESFDC